MDVPPAGQPAVFRSVIDGSVDTIVGHGEHCHRQDPIDKWNRCLIFLGIFTGGWMIFAIVAWYAVVRHKREQDEKE